LKTAREKRPEKRGGRDVDKKMVASRSERERERERE